MRRNERRDIAGDSPYLELKKQELKLRKEELRLKQEQAAKKAAGDAPDNEDGEKETVHIYLPDNGRGG